MRASARARDGNLPVLFFIIALLSTIDDDHCADGRRIVSIYQADHFTVSIFLNIFRPKSEFWSFSATTLIVSGIKLSYLFISLRETGPILCIFGFLFFFGAQHIYATIRIYLYFFLVAC